MTAWPLFLVASAAIAGGAAWGLALRLDAPTTTSPLDRGIATPAIADAAHNATASVRASARGRALGGSTIRVVVVVGRSPSVSRDSRIIVLF